MIFSYPLVFDAAVRGGGSRRNIAMPFGTEKLEWCSYPMVKKIDDMFIWFDRIDERDRQTHRQTPHDGMHLHSIARQKLLKDTLGPVIYDVTRY